jgi:hypothetical protein
VGGAPSEDALAASEQAAAGIRTETTEAGGARVVSVQRLEVALMVTGVWDTAEQREASDTRIADIRRRIFETGGARTPEVSRYEVLSVEFVGVGAATG